MSDPSGPGDETQSLGDKTLADHRPIEDRLKTPGSGAGAAKKFSIPEVELGEELGRGGMGVVFKGRQPYLDRKVAVKLLLTQQASNPQQFIDRFRREAKILASLAHPHIVSCFQAGTTTEGDAYLVMELIDGPNLREWVEKQGPLSEADALEVARDVARALEYAKASGIIHRDVKPENILLAKREKKGAAAGLPYTAKLVDLGLARPDTSGSGEMKLTANGVVVGTPATMAPEQFDDPDHIDFRADIYGLGCALYHALTGRAAFREPTLTQLMMRKAAGEVPDPRRERPELSEAASKLVRRMLAKSRDDRPQSYEALIAEIEAAARAGSQAAAPTVVAAAPAEKAAPAQKRRSGRIAAIALAILVVVAFTKVARNNRSKGEREADRDRPAATATSTASSTATPPVAAFRKQPTEALPAFDAAEPLTREAFLDERRLEGWTATRAGTFGASEETPGVQGQGTGLLSRAIAGPPWRFEATIQPLQGNSFGALVALEGKRAVGVSIQNLDQLLLATVVRLDAGADAIAQPVARPFNIGAAAPSGIPVVLTAGRTEVVIEANGKVLGAVPIGASEPAVGISLSVNKSTARFLDVVLKRTHPK
jgi:predicted Ser/Thr protein kinase